MYRGRDDRTNGYTIVETLIFLAVSAAMFVSAMALISGRQAKAEFTQGVRTFNSTLQDVANDVSTGYYADSTVNGTRFSCTANAVSVSLFAAGGPSDNQGTNKDCIFVGKTIQFGPNPAGLENYNLITLVGKRLVNGTSGHDVQTFQEANVTAVVPSAVSRVDATLTGRFGGGVTVECVLTANTVFTPATDHPCTNTPTAYKVDMLTFLTTFHGLDNSGNLESGSSQVDLIASKNTTSLGQTLSYTAQRINGFKPSGPTQNVWTNPAGGAFICLQSNGSHQFAMIQIGGGTSRFSSDTIISGGGCN